MQSNNQQEPQTAYGQTQAGAASTGQGQYQNTTTEQQPQQFASQNVQHGRVMDDTQQPGGLDSGRMNPTMGGVGGGHATGTAGGVGQPPPYQTEYAQTGQQDHYDGSNTQEHGFGRGRDGKEHQQNQQDYPDAKNHGGHTGQAVGAGLAGAGVGAEAAHHHHYHEQDRHGAGQQQSGIGQTGQHAGYGESGTQGHGFGRGDDGRDHPDTKIDSGQTGRNVGAGLAGAGVGAEAAHHHHHHQQDSHGAGQQQSGIGQTGGQARYEESGTQGHGFGRGGDGRDYQQSNQQGNPDAKNDGGNTGRNVGAGLVGAGVGAEAAHHHHQHEQNKQSSIGQQQLHQTGIGQTGQQGNYDGSDTRGHGFGRGGDGTHQQTNQHDVPDAQNHGGHTGRNVGVGLAGAGIAAEAGHHHHQHEQNKHGQQQSGIGQTGEQDNYDGSDTRGHRFGRGGDGTEYQQDNSDTKNHGGHTGRNVGLGLAGAGVGAEAAHHHHQHDQNKQSANVGGAAGHTGEYREGYDAVARQPSTGAGAQGGYAQSGLQNQQTNQHDGQNHGGHTGRNVGVGLAGAGVGAEALHHHHQHEQNKENAKVGGAAGHTGEYREGYESVAGNTSTGAQGGQASGYQQADHKDGHHVGPAVGAGVVGAGAGAEMAHHHHTHGAHGANRDNSIDGEAFNGPADQPFHQQNKTAGIDNSGGLAGGVGQPGVGQTTSGTNAEKQSGGHHVGPAVGAGVVGAGVGAEMAHHRHAQGAQGMQGGNSVHGEGFGGPAHQPSAPTGGTGLGGQQQTGGVGMGNQGIGSGQPDLTGTQGGGGINPGTGAAAAAAGTGVGTATGAGQGGFGGQSDGVTGGTQTAGSGGLGGKAQAYRQQTAGETKGPLRGVTAQTIGGKLQQIGGVLLGSTALKEKGIAREQRAAAQVDVHNAQRLEQEALARRERAVGLGAHPDHGKLGGKLE